MSGSNVRIREVLPKDYPSFFEFQSDAVARQMVAFGDVEPLDQKGVNARWEGIRASEVNLARTILCDERVVGNLTCFIAPWSGMREVGYWISRDFWGKGVATEALSQFLREFRERPLHARVAIDNLGSIRVLEKCGFIRVGTEAEFAAARGCEVEEAVLRLE